MSNLEMQVRQNGRTTGWNQKGLEVVCCFDHAGHCNAMISDPAFPFSPCARAKGVVRSTLGAACPPFLEARK